MIQIFWNHHRLGLDKEAHKDYCLEVLVFLCFSKYARHKSIQDDLPYARLERGSVKFVSVPELWQSSKLIRSRSHAVDPFISHEERRAAAKSASQPISSTSEQENMVASNEKLGFIYKPSTAGFSASGDDFTSRKTQRKAAITRQKEQGMAWILQPKSQVKVAFAAAVLAIVVIAVLVTIIVLNKHSTSAHGEKATLPITTSFPTNVLANSSPHEIQSSSALPITAASQTLSSAISTASGDFNQHALFSVNNARSQTSSSLSPYIWSSKLQTYAQQMPTVCCSGTCSSFSYSQVSMVSDDTEGEGLDFQAVLADWIADEAADGDSKPMTSEFGGMSRAEFAMADYISYIYKDCLRASLWNSNGLLLICIEDGLCLCVHILGAIIYMCPKCVE